jgi:SAM-dependent methyltransferase
MDENTVRRLEHDLPGPEMKLLDDDVLERSSTVANCQMNRQRSLNGYAKELRCNPLDLLLNSSAKAKVRWLDLCCGEGRALAEGAQSMHDLALDGRCEIIGVDLVAPPFRSERPSPCLRLVQASLTFWKPNGQFDLITCVHGLHYIGDKLGLIARAVSWLTDDGRFVANLDLNNIKLSDGRPANRILARELRRAGLEYDRRKKLLRCRRRIQAGFPFRYVGADDQAGPNYTKQPAVDSYYVPLGSENA